MIDLMERLSVSVPDDLAQRIRRAAESQGAGLSAWLARAAEQQLLLERAAEVISAWEREHGTITDAELTQVERVWRD